MFPLYDENKTNKKPYVNYVLIIANIVVFFYFLLFADLEDAIWTYGAIPSELLNGQRLWTLLTSMFMHADLMHIGGNMIYLWVFGDNIEATLGHVKYLIFYMVGGLFASFAHIFFTLLSGLSGLNPFPYVAELGIPSVGASGAISAVLGAYLLLYPRARIKTLVLFFFITIVSIPAYYYLGFWFLLQLLNGIISLTGFSSGVAFWAHIGGFVFGLITIKAFGARPRRRTILIPAEKPVQPLVASWARTPLIDVLVEADRLMVLAELPGVDEEDIKIDVSRWSITISAEHGEIKFHGRAALPAPITPKVENLAYRNGILRFNLYRTG